MSCYAAHIIMFVEFKDAVQEHYPVWENIVLIDADSELEAFEKAERLGHSEEGDEDGSFRWGSRPARWVFAGVRKLTECDIDVGSSNDGTELSYTEFELGSRESVRKMVTGESVQVLIQDRYRPPRSVKRDAEVDAKKGKRRRA